MFASHSLNVSLSIRTISSLRSELIKKSAPMKTPVSDGNADKAAPPPVDTSVMDDLKTELGGLSVC